MSLYFSSRVGMLMQEGFYYFMLLSHECPALFLSFERPIKH